MDRSLDIRPARSGDLEAFLTLTESVAAEGRWIGRELPLDREQVSQRFLDGLEPPDYSIVAERADRADGADREPGAPELLGQLHLGVARYGVAELGMQVAARARGRGVGRALLEDAIGWARREPDVHKIALQVWPHNDVAQNLYRSCGFEQEGYLRQHYRRRNGDRWDAVVMGLLLPA